MKVYIIIEDEYYPEDPSYRILGAVDSEEEAEKIVGELQLSVKEYNKSQRLYNVGYGYEVLEIGEAEGIDKRKEFNLGGRDWRRAL